MKNLVMRFGLALALSCSALNAHAQFSDVSGGSLSIAIANPLANLLATKNVTASVFTPAPYDWTIPFLGVQAGMIDLNNGSGSFSAQGTMVVTNAAGTVTLSVMGLQFEALQKVAYITGTVYLNGHGITRMALFTLTNGNPFPSPTSAGLNVQSNLPATLSPAFAATIQTAFGITVPQGLSAGLVSYNIGLCAMTYK